MSEVAFGSDGAVSHVRHIFQLDPRSFSVLTGFLSGDFAVVIASSFRRLSIELLQRRVLVD
jgi:hypothetical protein